MVRNALSCTVWGQISHTVIWWVLTSGKFNVVGHHFFVVSNSKQYFLLTYFAQGGRNYAINALETGKICVIYDMLIHEN